ncbi:MAG: aminotransferase class I/II-fold pyridoxal phosphate-dependent enzyme, partial [Lachnospiraceae bacterium]|nr:aminotransferase class I/II-fold pyridoxal phosphate-dependent enzyme [Lachnospiraceae bacterium]
YPDLSQGAFRQAAASAENKLSGGAFVTPENVLGGNGASELIMGIIRLINPKKVLLPTPCFYGYFHGIRSFGDITEVKYPLREEEGFALREDFLGAIDENVDLVILGNPNNPNGRVIPPVLLKKIVEKCKETGTALLVDECFLHLSNGGESAVKYLNSYDRVFVVNAYTKLFSIPGVRVGYVLAAGERIRELKGVLPEWNMSVFAQSAGVSCAETILLTDFVEMSVAEIKALRGRMEQDFRDLGITVYPSDTNFLLVRSPKNLYHLFLNREILIRDCGNFEGLGEGWYRIAVKDEKSYERMKDCFCFLT